MDKIIIKDLKLYAYHGVNPEEKIEGQNFVFDIECKADLSKPCQTDDVNDTVSYAHIIKLVRKVFTAEKYDLLEKAAQVRRQHGEMDSNLLHGKVTAVIVLSDIRENFVEQLVIGSG